MKLIKVAVACVNQTPFAWDEQLRAPAHGDRARARRGRRRCSACPSCAITGYGCEDAFFMDGLQDTAFAQLDALAPLTQGHGRRRRAARLSREGALQRGRAARRRQDRRLRREAVPRRRRHPLRAALVQGVAGRRGRRARAHRRGRHDPPLSDRRPRVRRRRRPHRLRDLRGRVGREPAGHRPRAARRRHHLQPVGEPLRVRQVRRAPALRDRGLARVRRRVPLREPPRQRGRPRRSTTAAA